MNPIKNSTFIFKSRVPKAKSSIDLINYCFQNYAAYWSDTRILFAKNQKKLEKNFLILKNFKMLEYKTRHIQYQNSLIWSILLAYKMKFKEIVLCGVDLQGPYFFESNILHNDQHPSFRKSLKLVNLIDSLKIIDSILLKPKGIKIYIGTNSTKLNLHFSQYYI